MRVPLTKCLKNNLHCIVYTIALVEDLAAIALFVMVFVNLQLKIKEGVRFFHSGIEQAAPETRRLKDATLFISVKIKTSTTLSSSAMGFRALVFFGGRSQGLMEKS